MPELPNIVRERLKVSKVNSAHPDADVLTAFAERSLQESEQAVVIEHLARCHDCRDILALALPAATSGEAAGAPVPLRAAWLRAPVLRWGVVAAGFAAFAVTGILQYQNQHQAERFVATNHSNAPAPKATSEQVSGAVELAKPMPGTSSPGSGAGFGNTAPAVPSRVRPREADDKTAASAKEHGAVAMTMNGLAAPSATGASALIKPGYAAPAPAAGSTAWLTADKRFGGPLKRSPSASQQTAATSSTTVEVSGAAPLVSANAPDQADKAFQYEAKVQQKDQPGAAGQRAFMDATVDKAKAPAAELGRVVPAPPPASPLAPRWAISTTGGLLRSFDQGITWAGVDVSTSQSASMVSAMAVAAKKQEYRQAAQDTRQLQAQSQPAPNQPVSNQSQTQGVSKSQAANLKAAPLAASLPVFRAVSAAGLEVWAGGTAGMLYHSADGGGQWTRVVLVTSGILSTGDIVSIAFPDPLHGQITTSTRELWITADAGQTWQKR